jgi:hypothetical protein
MNDQTDVLQDDLSRKDDQGEAPHAIKDVLAELLDQYQQRFPGVGISVLEVPAAA